MLFRSCQGAGFDLTGIQAGNVIYIKGSSGHEGAYEIVSVDSASQLTVSVVRGDESGDAVAIGNDNDVEYRVCSYDVQAGEVMFTLTQYFGLQPGCPESGYTVDDILESSGLRQASAYAVIASVYATLAGKEDEDGYWKKSYHYQKLFEKARERCRVTVEAGTDEYGDRTNTGGSFRVIRD